MNVKLVHILTDIEAKREQESIASLAPVAAHGIEYIQSVNEIYHGEKWKIQPNWGSDLFQHADARKYGAFQSFRKAVLNNYDPDLDALILCECDCVLTVTPKEFAEQVERSLSFCNKNSISYYTFGYRDDSPVYHTDDEHTHSYISDKIICAHCVMIPRFERDFVMSEIAYRPWETPDIWFNMVFHTRGPSRMGAMYEPIAKQHEGESLIDQCWKDKNTFGNSIYL